MKSAIRSLSLVLGASLVGACGSAAAPAAKTELLPADGGELGKAYAELAAAFKAADKARAGKLLDPEKWSMDNKQPSWFEQFVGDMQAAKIGGGKRQGDHATLFLQHDNYYGMLNATRVDGGWRFESPMYTGTSFGEEVKDCKATPAAFPCGAASAPDAQVAGTVQSHKTDMLTKKPLAPWALIDGVAVRMLDGESKALKHTTVLLAATAIDPQMLAQSGDIDNVKGWLHWPVLRLDIAPDGKTAKAEFYDGASRKNFDVGTDLSIDAGTPNRLRGKLKTDVKDAARFDLSFDVGTASECRSDTYRCAVE